MLGQVAAWCSFSRIAGWILVPMRFGRAPDRRESMVKVAMPLYLAVHETRVTDVAKLCAKRWS